MEEIDPEPEHGRQVARLALMLFDGLASLHGLGPRERRLLEAGSLVHDVGMSLAERRHHKRSHDLIKGHTFLMWRPEEVGFFALLARYHRKAAPSLKHGSFAALSERDRGALTRLSAILRLADGLDRTHLSTVQAIDVTYDAKTVWVKLQTYRDCGTEIWGAERKAGLFESVFSRRLNIEAVDGFHAEAP
jgi:exopolyphosphatase/guanosine-5'-triphosphate,3'-diphosphate pyrophosphatase